MLGFLKVYFGTLGHFEELDRYANRGGYQECQNHGALKSPISMFG